jgi:hypothetical protein
VASQTVALEEERKKLKQEREAYTAELAEQRESIRRQKVRVYLQELSQPDSDGNMLVGSILELAETILLGDPVGEGDAAIQLSEDAGEVGVHAYYRQAIEVLLDEVPRNVPSGRRIEPKDTPLGTNGQSAQLKAEREAARAQKAYAYEIEGIELTEEIKAKIEESLDRSFGPEVN